jgi:hypothetical protein
MCRWCISASLTVWNTLSKSIDERRDLVCCFVECEVAGFGVSDVQEAGVDLLQ